MAREIPEVVRAVAGLAAAMLDEARKLPETLPGLPVRIIGLAMQQAMKVQQQYAGLVARGDELFTGLRGEDEPGLATFDDDEPVPGTGFRESAFDRAADAPSSIDYTPTDAEVQQLPADPAADAVTATVDQLAEQVEDGRTSIEELAEAVPGTEEILDEIAIDELVDQAPAPDGTAATADATDADVTDEGIATAPEPSTAVDESGTPVAAATGVPADDGESPAAASGRRAGPQAAGTAPIDGYDGFSIAQLRGRLRGYQLSTVQDLLSYEEATRAREPYLRMLRNRLEKVEQQAVENSPLAPRG
jgi:hypothetical protein